MLTMMAAADGIIEQLLEGDESSDDGGRTSRHRTRPGLPPRDATDDFIDAYRKEECLWNERDENFKDTYERQLSIERIADHCEMDERAVRLKIDNLRRYYKTALVGLRKKEQIASKHPRNNTPVTSPWRYFDGIDFLREHINVRNRRSDAGVNGSSSKQAEVQPESSKDAVCEDDLPIAAEVECLDDDSDSPQVEDVSDSSWSPPSKKKKRPNQQSTSTNQGAKKKKTAAKKRQNSEDSNQLAATKLTKLQKEAEQSSEDPEEIFGRHIAHELRSITDQRCKQYVKMEIQKLLFEAQW